MRTNSVPPNDYLHSRIMHLGRIDILEAELQNINHKLQILHNNAKKISTRRRQLVRDMAAFYLEQSRGAERNTSNSDQNKDILERALAKMQA